MNEDEVFNDKLKQHARYKSLEKFHSFADPTSLLALTLTDRFVGYLKRHTLASSGSAVAAKVQSTARPVVCPGKRECIILRVAVVVGELQPLFLTARMRWKERGEIQANNKESFALQFAYSDYRPPV